MWTCGSVGASERQTELTHTLNVHAHTLILWCSDGVSRVPLHKYSVYCPRTKQMHVDTFKFLPAFRSFASSIKDAELAHQVSFIMQIPFFFFFFVPRMERGKATHYPTARKHFCLKIYQQRNFWFYNDDEIHYQRIWKGEGEALVCEKKLKGSKLSNVSDLTGSS